MDEVKFKQGQYANLAQSLVGSNTDTLFFAQDKAVMGAAGQLYYGQPTITYTDNKLVLWGVSGETSGEVELGSVDLTLDSFLEKAKYFGTGATMAEVATWAGDGFDADAVEAAYKSAFEAETLPEEHSAIVMVMHTEASSGDSHSLVVIPVGKLMGDVQTEVDNIEKAVGLNEDGTYSATTGAHYTDEAESVMDAIVAVDSAIGAVEADEEGLNIIEPTVGDDAATISENLIALDKKISAFTASPEYAPEFSAATENAIATDDTVGDALAKLDNKVKALVDEVLDNEETTANAIDALATAAGVTAEGGEIKYVANTAATYIDEAESLKDADDKLDEAIKKLAEKVSANELQSADETIIITSTTTTSGDAVTDVKVNIDGVTLEQGTDKKIKVNVDNSAVSETEGGIKLDDENANGLTAKLYWGTFGAA